MNVCGCQVAEDYLWYLVHIENPEKVNFISLLVSGFLDKIRALFFHDAVVHFPLKQP